MQHCCCFFLCGVDVAIDLGAISSSHTNLYVRSLEASVDMPLDADVFQVPPGFNAPHQVGADMLPLQRGDEGRHCFCEGGRVDVFCMLLCSCAASFMASLIDGRYATRSYMGRALVFSHMAYSLVFALLHIQCLMLVWSRQKRLLVTNLVSVLNTIVNSGL
ncbi:hypothetical protein GOP47_0024686 [Adiantum capillus-veneris]|uniref:Uncharacterized protein n=1 Tax=Adiantum capillus-veneris TaxID=13818 RepID=A0A9D4Z599_ADICA|nr:hypothetical protein GOP47_0024686 [Adiantum capillus-veneris]